MSHRKLPVINNAILIRQRLGWQDCVQIAQAVYPRLFTGMAVALLGSWLFFVYQRLYWPQAIRVANVLVLVMTILAVVVSGALIVAIIKWNKFTGMYGHNAIICFDQAGNMYLPQKTARRLELYGSYSKTENCYIIYDKNRFLPVLILLKRGFSNDTEFHKLEEIFHNSGMKKISC